MKYQIILTAGARGEQAECAAQIAGFLKQNNLDPADGQIITVSGQAEDILTALEPVCESSLVIFEHGAIGEELAARLSMRLGGTAMTNVLGLQSVEDGQMDADDGSILVRKKVYGGHLEGTFRLSTPPYCITIDKSQEEAEPDAGMMEEAVFLKCEPSGETGRDRVVEPARQESDLKDAKFVVAGGRGLASRQSALEMMAAAETMGAASGGTRPAIMNGWIPYEKLIGVSGEMIRPELCIVCGASGSPAFYAGIERSRIIIAINTDEHAPMMKKSDVSVCADWREVLRELVKLTDDAQ